MWEAIILTTFLLLMFLGLRYIVDGKISARFQYALWLIVAVRLLFAWIPMPDSRISILPLLRDSVGMFTQSAQDSVPIDIAEERRQGEFPTDRESLMESETVNANEAAADIERSDNNEVITEGTDTWQIQDPEVQQTVPVQEDGVVQPVSAGQKKTADSLTNSHSSEKKEYDEIDDTTPVEKNFNTTKIIWGTYIVGVCVMFCAILLRNLIFYLRLRKLRIRYEGELPITHIPGKVYLLEQASSPFLLGRNIYIAPEMIQNTNSLRYCLAHEICHYRQGDMFWSVIRNLCLVMYWYHPLVWLCARLSDHDAELACDERVIALLGEEHRLDYGEALLAVIKNQAGGRTYIKLSTQMSGSKRNVEKRMKRIAEKKKKWFSAAAFVIIGLAIAVLSTMPGTASDNDVSGRDTTVASDGMTVDSSSDWSVTETEGFPAMVVDEKGDIVDFIRGNLITKLYLDYARENIERADEYPYSIKEHAFSNCVNLKTLIISHQSNTRSYIKEIADNAFEGCPKDMVVYCEEASDVWDYFKKVGFSVKAFDDRGDVFWGTLGENPEELEKLADKTTPYYDTDEEPALTKEEMRQVYGEPYFVMTQSGRLLTVANSHSLSAYAESEVLFPKEATVIDGTFCEDTTLTKTITIPKHIKEIGDISFQDCPIRQLVFEEGSTLERIGSNAFTWCKFSEVQLPEGLKSIGGNAFVFCQELKEITIPASVETLEKGCFSGCGLETVTILNPKVEFQGDTRLTNEQVFDTFMYDEKKKEMVPNTKLTIICYQGSTAEVYARQLGLAVRYIQPPLNVNIYSADTDELEFPQLIRQHEDLVQDEALWKSDDGSYHFPPSRYGGEYLNLNEEERLVALQFPEKILQAVDTDTLLSLVLETSIPENVRKFDSKPGAFIEMSKRYNSIYALLGRSDFYEAVLKYFEEYHVPKKMANDTEQDMTVIDTIDFCTVVLLGMTANVKDKSIKKAANVVYDKYKEIEATEYRDDVLLKRSFVLEPHFQLDKRVTVHIDAYNRKKAEEEYN